MLEKSVSGNPGVRLKKIAAVVILVLVCTTFSIRNSAAFDTADMENWLRQAEVSLAKTESYRTVFHKQ